MSHRSPERRRSSRWQRVRLSIGLVSVAIVAAVGWWFAPGALLVEAVTFEGNQRASDAALRHLVDLPNGTTVLDVDLQQVARGAEAHPWVRSAVARLSWRRVTVSVEERRAVALAERDGALVYVDETGVPFLEARADDLDYPRIAGIGPDVAGLHPDLVPLVLRDATALLSDLDTRGLVTADDVSEVVFLPTRGFTVHTRSGAEVLFGLDGHPAQLERLAALLDQGVDLSQRIHVDLAPERVAIVRPVGPGRGPTPGHAAGGGA